MPLCNDALERISCVFKERYFLARSIDFVKSCHHCQVAKQPLTIFVTAVRIQE